MIRLKENHQVILLQVLHSNTDKFVLHVTFKFILHAEPGPGIQKRVVANKPFLNQFFLILNLVGQQSRTSRSSFKPLIQT